MFFELSEDFNVFCLCPYVLSSLSGSRWLVKEEMEELLVEDISDQDVRTEDIKPGLSEEPVACVIQYEHKRVLL